MPILEMITKRLEAFGYSLKPGDDFTLGFLIKKVENHIKGFCNIDIIPVDLDMAIADMVCSEFLFEKKATGALTLRDIDFGGAIKSISEGDTTVSFMDGGTVEQKLDNFILYLADKHKVELYKYRKLVW